jgi:solute carrier family 25 (mitochondrial uncoupling protein), member 8/9
MAQPKKLPVYASFLCGGAAACWAEVCTIPLDTIKVRLQIQGQTKKYSGMLNCLTTVVAEEGPTALWKGLVPGLLRQSIFATLRIGLYEHVRNFYHPQGGDPPLYKKIAAGLTTGVIGISIASPTDLVKVRLQAEGRLPPGTPRRYNGTIDAFSKILKQEGLFGFWKGVGPNMVRNSIINAAELASYDQAKQAALAHGLPDNIGTHLLCGTTAGFVATCAGSPADVIKTRVMNQKVAADGTKEYRSGFHALAKIVRDEGPMALYKGFWPNFARIGTWNIVMFLTFEQLKARLF